MVTSHGLFTWNRRSLSLRPFVNALHIQTHLTLCTTDPRRSLKTFLMRRYDTSSHFSIQRDRVFASTNTNTDATRTMTNMDVVHITVKSYLHQPMYNTLYALVECSHPKMVNVAPAVLICSANCTRNLGSDTCAREMTPLPR